MVETRTTTDIYGNLEIYSLRNGNWVEYNVDVPKTSKYRIDLRYVTNQETVVKADCAGAVSSIAVLPAVSQYTTFGFEMTLPKGKQTIRLSVPSGNMSLNWLRFTSPIGESSDVVL